MVDTVLGRSATGRAAFLKMALLALGGTAFIALSAQVSVPFYPVPMTLQTLAILIVGLTFGARLGAATLALYLAEGAMGLPVFAGGASAPALIGPTAGFLFGFAGMAWLVGLAADRGLARGFVMRALCCVVIAGLLYIPGVAWPMAVADMAGASGRWAGVSAEQVWTSWVSPFLLGDMIKAIVAALLVCGGRPIWKAHAKTVKAPKL
uniref:biotin transporter BioY n=1 Tax=Roseovarius indicus TaxID=540747 RepID=UPI003B522CFE